MVGGADDIPLDIDTGGRGSRIVRQRLEVGGRAVDQIVAEAEARQRSKLVFGRAADDDSVVVEIAGYARVAGGNGIEQRHALLGQHEPARAGNVIGMWEDGADDLAACVAGRQPDAHEADRRIDGWKRVGRWFDAAIAYVVANHLIPA